MNEKIMSRVLVGFDKTTEIGARTHGHGFFERLPHKSPFGAKTTYFDELFFKKSLMILLKNVKVIFNANNFGSQKSIWNSLKYTSKR